MSPTAGHLLLPLPLTSRQLLQSIIGPAYLLLPPYMRDPAADVMLVAIAYQEADLRYRKQINGPARGLWQFERGGGVAGVLRHAASKHAARDVCAARGVSPDAATVYATLEYDDLLAACFARLLLWTDPFSLPALTDAKAAWALYERTWRPGQPHPEKWWCYHRLAREAVAWNT
jgi:hypothetical protein